MNRLSRVTLVCAVLAVMTYATWLISDRYWHPQDYRTITPGVMYATDTLTHSFLERFRAHFANITVVDLAGEAAPAAPGGATLADAERLGQVQRLAIPANTLPTIPQTMGFLALCADGNSYPIILYTGNQGSGGLDVRAAALEAAYLYFLAGRSLDDAIAEAGLKGHPLEGQVRGQVAEIQRRKSKPESAE